MARIPSTRSTAFWLAGLVLAAAVLLPALPAEAQAIKVTSAVPDITDQGTVDLVVAIGGENFGRNSRVSFFVTGTTNPGGITVKNVRYKDARNLDATIDVAPDAQTDLKFDIQVQSGSRTGKGTELFSVKRPVLPPADPHIAFWEPPKSGFDAAIYVCNGDGQRDTPVYTSTTSISSPTLSPSRNAVSFVRHPDTTWSITRVDFEVVNGDILLGAVQDLYHAPPGDSINGLAWSPDGTKIAFVAYRGGTDSLIQLMPDTGLLPGENPTTLYTLTWPLLIGTRIMWNPAGDTLYFSENNNDLPGSYVIKALELDSYGNPIDLQVVFSNPAFSNNIADVAVAWTQPSLAFTSSGFVYTLDLTTGAVALVSAGSWASWSPDDSQIVFQRQIKAKQWLQISTLATGEITTLRTGRQPDWK